MPRASLTPEQCFSAVSDELLADSAVTVGAGKKGFGSSALCVNEKIFAMLAGERFVVKLPRGRVDALVESGNGERFQIGQRLMKEWLAMEEVSEKEWIALAREAMEFVGSKG